MEAINTAPGNKLEYRHLTALNPKGYLLKKLYAAVWRLGIPTGGGQERMDISLPVEIPPRSTRDPGAYAAAPNGGRGVEGHQQQHVYGMARPGKRLWVDLP